MWLCALELVLREELLNGAGGGRPRPLTQRSGPNRFRRIRRMSRDREPKNLSAVARGCGAFCGHLDLHWMGHSCDVRRGTSVEIPEGASHLGREHRVNPPGKADRKDDPPRIGLRLRSVGHRVELAQRSALSWKPLVAWATRRQLAKGRPRRPDGSAILFFLYAMEIRRVASQL